MFDEMYVAMMYSQMVLAPVISVAVAIPILIYIVARWRSYREETSPDPQIGMKVAICWFQIAAFQMILLAVFLLLYSAIGDLPSGMGEEVIRIALGISLPGSIVFGLQVFAIRATNSEQRPSVHRMFSGVSLVQSGLIAFGAIMIGGIFLFQKNVPTELNRAVLSAVFVYGVASIVQGVRLLRHSTGEGRLPAAVAAENLVGPSFVEGD